MRRDLIEAARRGDHEAFEVLATSAGDRLYAVVRLVVNACADQGRQLRRWSQQVRPLALDASIGDDTGSVADREQLERGFSRLRRDRAGQPLGRQGATVMVRSRRRIRCFHFDRISAL